VETVVKVKRKSLYRKEKFVAVLYILLPLIGFAVFTAGTTVVTAAYSFLDFRGVNGDNLKAVGFKNYADLFTSPLLAESFIRSITTTLLLLIGVPVGMAAGLAVAQLLNDKGLRGGKAFRVLLYLPAVSSAVALNIVWRYIFNSDYGLAGFVFGRETYWLSDPVLVKVAIAAKGVWGGLGGTMLLYLAGMQNISRTYYEAAEIDGASGLTKFFKITLPMLTPVTFYLLVMGLIGGLQSYTDSQVFAGGTEHAQTVVFFIWQRGISNARYGLASAASVLLALVIMAATLVQFKLSNKWVYEE
jgi:multiple sugar transport system permease protein